MNALIRTALATSALVALALLPTHACAVQYGIARAYIVDNAGNQLNQAAGSDLTNDCGMFRFSTSYMWKNNNAIVNLPATPYTATGWCTDYYEQTKNFNISLNTTTQVWFYLQRPLLKLSFAPTSITAGNTSIATVTLRNIADSANVKVHNNIVLTLTSANTAVATVPASVTVNAMASTATFTVTGVAAGTSLITATPGWSGGTAVSATITVN
ncbi:MAG: hypothetical protein H0W72_01335 [Planctomycetes bacterium]|nr:hypothetical protein [Planctomycetota bacterium]